MDALMILREEAVCLVLLIFLILNARYYRMGKDSPGFFRLSLYAAIHVLFDILSVLVSGSGNDPGSVQIRAAHTGLLITSMLYTSELCGDCARRCGEDKLSVILRKTGCALAAVLAVAGLLFPIRFRDTGELLCPSGILFYTAYGLSMFFLLLSFALVLSHRKVLPASARIALYPMITIMATAEAFMLPFPELLFTGGAVTIVTVGIFFSLENPADVFARKAELDALTGVHSRNAYENDIRTLDEEYHTNHARRFSLVFCDINGLKAVNNNFGHPEGDHYISTIAQILMQELKHAWRIYRMGGDEFMAIYRDIDPDTVEHEINRVHEVCREMTAERPYTVEAAVGYASTGEQYRSLRDVLRVADFLMYKNKAEIKRSRAFLTEYAAGMPNLAGLTDRSFDAFSSPDDRNSLFLTNLETNVTRISHGLAEQLGLKEEFIHEIENLWYERIHPDDLSAFRESSRKVLMGQAEQAEAQYRIRDRSGNYVFFTARGSVLKGKEGSPDLFAGTVINHGIRETVDPVTGLNNDLVLTERMEQILAGHGAGTLMKFSILSYSRVNMLYGYPSGNDLLRQFGAAVRRHLKAGGELFRLEGTEFVIWQPGMEKKDAETLYTQIREIAARELKAERLVIPLRIAAGALILEPGYTGNVTDLRSCLIYAHEQSMYESGGQLVFYDHGAQDPGNAEYRLLSRIHQDALGERAGFSLHYQPIASTANGRITGAEALLRWKGEPYGEVLPDRFIPWLENDPCFLDLGLWIIRRALEDTSDFLKQDPSFIISVNATAPQLLDESFRATVLSLLKDAGIEPGHLCLELTERCRDLDLKDLKRSVDSFRREGIQIALDDVGTGTATMGLLMELQVDEIKLDRSLIRTVKEKPFNRVVLRTMAEAARSFGERVCMEGIEDKDTLEDLKQYGADLYQGWYFSRAIPADDLLGMLKRDNPA